MEVDKESEQLIKTILVLACSAQYLHLSLDYLSGLCSRCKDFHFSPCALHSLSPSVPFPQIALINPYLNDFSFVWLMDKKIHFSTWRVARVVLMNKLMLEIWGYFLFPTPTKTPLRTLLSWNCLPERKGGLLISLWSLWICSQLFLYFCFSFRELFWVKYKQTKWILTIIAPMGADLFCSSKQGCEN